MTKEQAQAAIDAESIKKIEELCAQMTLAQLWRFCEGTLRASALSQRILVERFGIEEWKRFNLAVESGRIKV